MDISLMVLILSHLIFYPHGQSIYAFRYNPNFFIYRTVPYFSDETFNKEQKYLLGKSFTNCSLYSFPLNRTYETSDQSIYLFIQVLGAYGTVLVLT
jgi:hypothetical protein